MSVFIGITTSYEEGQQRLDRSYVQAVESAGGLPAIVPLPAERATMEELVEHLDGLIIPGGPAVTDGLVGDLPAELHENTPLRRWADYIMLGACLERDVPVLGICYGMQLISAYKGGSIYGDVERQLHTAAVHSDKRGASEHLIHMRPGSHLARILGMAPLSVNTCHLQAIKTPGDGLQACAWATDGVIEAIEDESGNVMGVQFHPERMEDAMQPLFQAFVERARAYRASTRI